MLPFENLGAQPGSDEFALGLSYAIQNNLASVQDISLISFAASSAFPSKGRNLRQIADELGATYILEGSIFRADGVLRINAELVRVEDGVADLDRAVRSDDRGRVRRPGRDLQGDCRRAAARRALAEDDTRRAPISMTCTCVRNSSR